MHSHFGHDKSLALRPYKQMAGKRPTIFFCGDGVSDMCVLLCVSKGDFLELRPRSAAGESDVLFVKVRSLAMDCSMTPCKASVQLIPGHTNDLATHCDREKIRYLPFLSFKQVEDKVRDVVEGRLSVADIEAGKVRIEEVERAMGRGQ